MEILQTEKNLKKEFINNQYLFVKFQKKWSPLNNHNLIHEKNEEKELDLKLRFPEFEDEFEEDLKNINKDEPLEPNFRDFRRKRQKSLSKPKHEFAKSHSNPKNIKFREQIEGILEECKKNNGKKREIKKIEKNLMNFNTFLDNKLDYLSKNYLK